eukprot:SAG11_NODE_1126_length_5765_cov_9.701553_2_plen_66_part_00
MIHTGPGEPAVDGTVVSSFELRTDDRERYRGEFGAVVLTSLAHTTSKNCIAMSSDCGLRVSTTVG